MESRRLRRRPHRGADLSPTKADATTTAEAKPPSASNNKRNSTLPSHSSPGRRASPGRLHGTQRHSPVRRSSRPRSTTLGSSASSTATTVTVGPVNVPSPIKEANQADVARSKSHTAGSNPEDATAKSAAKSGAISSRPPIVAPTMTKLAYTSTTTEETIEIRYTGGDRSVRSDASKLSDLRRSVSKTLTDVITRTHTPTTNNSETDSRFSRSVSGSVYDEDRYSKAEFSDKEDADDVDDQEDVLEEEEEEVEEHFKSFNATQQQSFSAGVSPQLCRKLDTPREFGGWFGALVCMLLAPCVVYYLQWSCSKSGCQLQALSLRAIADAKYLSKHIFVTEAVGAFILFNLSIFVLSAVLFGFRVRLASFELRSAVQHKFNVLPMAVVVSAAAGLAEFYWQYPVADFVLKHYLRFCVYGFVNAFVVAFWCYVRVELLRLPSSGDQQVAQWNTYGKSGNFLVDYALGRQLNPKWLGFVEFKLVFYRVALLATLLFAESLLYKSIRVAALPAGTQDVWAVLHYYARTLKTDPVALLTASQLFVYATDAIVFEHHLASSFELQGEGLGCLLLLRYAASPYLLAAVAKYFCEQRVPISCKYAVYVSVAVFVAGLILKRLSNAVKYKYRVNPTNPIFAGIDTIHTFQGKRLLLGALWGRLRQPNYAGDILALIGLGLPLFLRFAWPPLLSLALCVVLLLHRAVRVNARNKARYHSSWVRYSSAVRYYILPKVF